MLRRQTEEGRKPAWRGAPRESLVNPASLLGPHTGPRERRGLEGPPDAFQGTMASALPEAVGCVNRPRVPASETLGWALRELDAWVHVGVWEQGREPQSSLHHLHSPLTWLGLGPGPADFSTKQERAEGTREPGHALGPSADTPDWLREGGRHQRQSGPLGWAPQRTWSPQPVLGPISPLRLHLRPAGGLRNEAESLPLVSLGLPPIRENFRPLQSV